MVKKPRVEDGVGLGEQLVKEMRARRKNSEEVPSPIQIFSSLPAPPFLRVNK
jgi:hypothetical protein